MKRLEIISGGHGYGYKDDEEKEEEEIMEPVSPTGQYFNSSILSVSVVGVLEAEIPIVEDDSLITLSLINDVFLHINPRFSSIMVEDEKGVKKWKKVEVNPKNHIHYPVFPEGKTIEFYDKCFNDYLTKLAIEKLPQTQPLWEIHIIKYPTKNAAGNLVFKLHHALGDGFSLMGALLSCLHRADDPSLPITFPEFRTTVSDHHQPIKNNNNNCNNNDESNNNDDDDNHDSIFRKVRKMLSRIGITIADFTCTLMKSTFVEDDETPIRSGDDGIEFRPVTITTMEFSIDDIKKIKTNAEVSINDVICGVIFLGTRLYMKAMNPKKTNANTTALVLLNTRNIAGYKTLSEMVEPNPNSKWGNQFGFLHVSVPDLITNTSSDPFDFVYRVNKIVKKKRNSGAVFLTGKLLDTLRKHTGPEVTAKYIRKTLKNSSFTISNIFGPVDKLALANHPAKGMYFMVVGVPQSLTITIVSYMRKLRIAVAIEKGFIDPSKYNSCIQEAFEIMYKAATGVASPSSTNN